MPQKYSGFLLPLFPLTYLLTAICIAAIVAYPIDQVLDPNISFPRLINRITLGLLIIGIIPMKQRLNLTLSDMGFDRNISTIAKQIATGFVFGLAILGIVVAVLVLLDVRIVLYYLIELPGKLSHEIIASIRSSILVAIAEETLFRGLLFAALLKYGSVPSAVVITGLFYAGLHFMGGHGSAGQEPSSLFSVFQLIPHALSQVFLAENFDSLLALFTVSLFLTTILLVKPSGIGYCIGLHASWVGVIRLTKAFSALAPNDPNWGFLVGSYNGIIGYLAAIWLATLTVIFWAFANNRKN